MTYNNIQQIKQIQHNATEYLTAQHSIVQHKHNIEIIKQKYNKQSNIVIIPNNIIRHKITLSRYKLT